MALHVNVVTPPLVVRYTNYRGETAVREIVPLEVFYGSTPAASKSDPRAIPCARATSMAR